MQSLSLAFSAFCVLALGAFVLRRGYREHLSRAFSWFTACGALWALAVAAITYPATPLPLMVPIGHVAFIGGILAVSGFWAFTLIFPSPAIPPARRRFVWGVYTAGVLFGILAATPLVYVGPDSSTVGQGVVRPLYGPLFPLFIAFAMVCTAAAIGELVRKYRRTALNRERVQVAFLLLGCTISFASGVLLTLVLPLFNITRFGPLAPLSIVATFAAAALAITRHRLFNLGVVFRQTLTAAGLTLALSFLILGLMTAVRMLFGDDPSYQMMGMFVTSVIAAFLLPTIRAGAEYGVDRYIFDGPPVDIPALRRLSRELTTMLSVTPLSDLLVAGIGRALRLRHATLYLADSQSPHWNAQASWPGDFPAWPELPATSPIIAAVRERMAPVTCDAVRRDDTETAALRAPAFAALEAECVVPLVAEGELLGVIVLGEKQNGDLLSDTELGEMTTLAHQASTALANAMLHEQIVRMKLHNDNILRAMVSGVIAVDGRGRLTTCNRRAEEMLGVPAAELMGGSAELLPSILADALREARLHGRTVEHRTGDMPRHDGTIYNIALHTSVLRNDQGQTIGALSVFEDQTDRLRLEEGLQRADRLASLGTLAAGLAHEIKNPLVSVRTLAQLLPSKFDDPEFRDTFAQLAAGEVDRINELVERLLAFARPSPPSLQYIQLTPVVEDVLQLLRAELDSHSVAVDRTDTDAPAWVYADPAQMRQVFLNLFMNALHAMEASPARRLSIALDLAPVARAHISPPRPWTSSNGDGIDLPPGRLVALTVRVADTGPGIPDALREDIFNPFFTTKPKGSGLGLSVVARIVRDHGGDIAVESDTGEGACFVLHFPAYVSDRVPSSTG